MNQKNTKCKSVSPSDQLSALNWLTKAIVLDCRGRHNEAQVRYRKALELDPYEKGIWDRKGRSLTWLGRYEEALGCFDRAIELGAQDADIWVGRGISLHALLRNDEAMACFGEALERNARCKWPGTTKL